MKVRLCWTYLSCEAKTSLSEDFDFKPFYLDFDGAEFGWGPNVVGHNLHSFVYSSFELVSSQWLLIWLRFHQNKLTEVVGFEHWWTFHLHGEFVMNKDGCKVDTAVAPEKIKFYCKVRNSRTHITYDKAIYLCSKFVIYFRIQNNSTVCCLWLYTVCIVIVIVYYVGRRHMYIVNNFYPHTTLLLEWTIN